MYNCDQWCSNYSNWQVLSVQRAMYAWLVDLMTMRAKWKCALGGTGGRFVTIFGTMQMHQSSANSFNLEVVSLSSLCTCSILSIVDKDRFWSDGVAITELGNETERIVLDDVECTGEEDHLLNCSQKPIGEDHNCSPKEEAGVTCFSGKEID